MSDNDPQTPPQKSVDAAMKTAVTGALTSPEMKDALKDAVKGVAADAAKGAAGLAKDVAKRGYTDGVNFFNTKFVPNMRPSYNGQSPDITWYLWQNVKMYAASVRDPSTRPMLAAAGKKTAAFGGIRLVAYGITAIPAGIPLIGPAIASVISITAMPLFLAATIASVGLIGWAAHDLWKIKKSAFAKDYIKKQEEKWIDGKASPGTGLFANLERKLARAALWAGLGVTGTSAAVTAASAATLAGFAVPAGIVNVLNGIAALPYIGGLCAFAGGINIPAFFVLSALSAVPMLAGARISWKLHKTVKKLQSAQTPPAAEAEEGTPVSAPQGGKGIPGLKRLSMPFGKSAQTAAEPAKETTAQEIAAAIGAGTPAKQAANPGLADEMRQMIAERKAARAKREADKNNGPAASP